MMPHRLLLLTLTTCLAATAGATAIAAEPDPLPPVESCRLDLRPPSSVYFRGARSRGYEVFSDLRHIERFQVSVQHRGAACDYVLVAYNASGGKLSGGAGGAGGSINYALRQDAGGRDLVSIDPSGTSDTQIAGSSGRGAKTDLYDFYLDIPPQQFVSGGSYSDTVTFRLYRIENGQQHLEDEAGVSISTEVPGEIQASVGASPTGPREQNVDLGQLTTGLRRTLGFTARSNLPFEVSLSSQNGGKLRHEFSSATVPYTVRFGGRTMILDTSPIVALTEASIGQVMQYDFDLQVGAVTPRTPAGGYTDTVIVTITTL